ncbi:MAG: hypothetical protein NTW29_11330 [Bacteroidetes bacterium]|nr:hypothetical protein [Bacteroidota bacterium]
MIRTVSLILITAIVAISCNNNKQGSGNAASDTTKTKTEQPAIDPTADSTQIRQVIVDFYEWYVKNDSRLQAFHLYEGIRKKDMPPYRINWEETKKYQQYIRDNIPWLGEAFLQRQTTFLQECDSAFKAYPDDEMPYGFDYDWYTNSQEDPVYTLDMIRQSTSWNITWKGEYASVQIQTVQDYDGKRKEATFLTLLMKKENNTWKIARIGNEE